MVFVRRHLPALTPSNRWRHLRCLLHGAHHQLYEQPFLLILQTWQRRVTRVELEAFAKIFYCFI